MKAECMQCKKCTKGLVLVVIDQEIPEEVRTMFSGELIITTMNSVACDCCGGYYEDCENCRVGKQVIEWEDGCECTHDVYESTTKLGHCASCGKLLA